MNFNANFWFYFLSIIATSLSIILLIIQYRKDKLDENARKYAFTVVLVAIVLLTGNFISGLVSHVQGNMQEDSAKHYILLYSELLKKSNDTSNATLDSARNILRQTSSLLFSSDSLINSSNIIIGKQNKSMELQTASLQQLNKQINSTTNRLAKLTQTLNDSLAGKGTYCYLMLLPYTPGKGDSAQFLYLAKGKYPIRDIDIEYEKVKDSNEPYALKEPRTNGHNHIDIFNPIISSYVINPLYGSFRAIPSSKLGLVYLDKNERSKIVVNIRTSTNEYIEYIRLHFINGRWEWGIWYVQQFKGLVFTEFTHNFSDSLTLPYKVIGANIESNKLGRR